jgi:hypothetical protein
MGDGRMRKAEASRLIQSVLKASADLLPRVAVRYRRLPLGPCDTLRVRRASYLSGQIAIEIKELDVVCTLVRGAAVA